MKARKISVIILVLIAGLYFCYVNFLQRTEVGIVTIKNPIINLGVIKKNAPAVATFELKNDGPVDLVISEIVPDCHCTVPESETKVIKPGKVGTLKVSYDTKNIGYFNQSISITLNTAKKVDILVIRGQVI